MTRKQRWDESAIGDQSGRVAVVTGSNSGIGFETARALAEHGATVVLACRNVKRAAAARDRIAALVPSSSVDVLVTNLGDLDAVEVAAKQFVDRFDRLDLLINNAGVILVAEGKTPQGLEMHIGVNHFGHFALSGRLLPRLLDTEGSRVVTVASAGHKVGRVDPDDLGIPSPYKPMKVYGRSKLANLLFTSEFQRRLAASGASTIALAAHPGGAKSDVKETEQASGVNPVMWRFRNLIERFLQPAAMGALPTLRAATDPNATGDQYYGPDGFMEQRGHPVLAKRSKRAVDLDTARRLWDVSVKVTGVDFAALEPSA